MLLAILLALASQAAAQTPCSQTERASATSYGAFAAPSSTPVSSVLQACENPGEVEAEPEASVYDDAIALWKLDETSDGSAPVVRVDSIGSLDLTDNNTVGSEAKGVGAPANLPANVASFVAANSEYFSIESTDLGLSSACTFAWWFKYPTASATYRKFLTKFVGGTPSFYFDIYEDDARLLMGSDYHGPSQLNISTGSWHLMVVWQDGVDGKSYSQLDGGSVVTSAAGNLPNLAAGKLSIGSDNGASHFYDGQMSSLAIWDRVLTSDERTALYNSGNGAPLP